MNVKEKILKKIPIIEFIEIKKNFVKLTEKKYTIIKNPYYDYIKKNKILLSYINNKRKLPYNRKSLIYCEYLRKSKNIFYTQNSKIKFYEKNLKEFNKNKNNLSNYKFIFMKNKKIYNAFLGYVIFFRIKFVKTLNYLFIIFLIFYFELNEFIFSELLDPRIKNKSKNINDLYYIPSFGTYIERIKNKAVENSLMKEINEANKKNFQEIRDSFPNQDEIRRNMDKNPNLRFQKLKMFFLGPSYELKYFKEMEIDNENMEIWNKSFLLRKLFFLKEKLSLNLMKLRFILIGDMTVMHFIMKKIHLESYYNYRLLTFNEKIKVHIQKFKNSGLGIKFLEHFEKEYTPRIKNYLKEYLLNLFKNKDFKDKFVDWLTKYLLVRTDFRDFLLEKILNFSYNYLNSTKFDEVNN